MYAGMCVQKLSYMLLECFINSSTLKFIFKNVFYKTRSLILKPQTILHTSQARTKYQINSSQTPIKNYNVPNFLIFIDMVDKLTITKMKENFSLSENIL